MGSTVHVISSGVLCDGLRSCATLKPKPPKPGVETITLADRVNLARNQLNRGQFREARKVALDAKRNAGKSAEARDLMRLNETLALIHLQLGQTAAAHDLCSSIPAARHTRYVQQGVGHYGVFNGTRWRTEIQPRIRDMIRAAGRPRRTASSPTSS